jgi:hypothetical protein
LTGDTNFSRPAAVENLAVPFSFHGLYTSMRAKSQWQTLGVVCAGAKRFVQLGELILGNHLEHDEAICVQERAKDEHLKIHTTAPLNRAMCGTFLRTMWNVVCFPHRRAARPSPCRAQRSLSTRRRRTWDCVAQRQPTTSFGYTKGTTLAAQSASR